MCFFIKSPQNNNNNSNVIVTKMKKGLLKKKNKINKNEFVLVIYLDNDKRK